MYYSLLLLIDKYLSNKFYGFLSNSLFKIILEQDIILLIEKKCLDNNLPQTYLWFYQNFSSQLNYLNLEFIWACSDGYYKIVKLLIKDFRVNPSHCVNCAIRVACQHGHFEIVQLLLQDSRIDPSDFHNEAIQFACQKGHLEIVKLLLQNSRVDPSDYSNLSIQLACKYGYLEIVQLHWRWSLRVLQDSRVDPSYNYNLAIHWASEQNHVEIVQLLLTDPRVRKLIKQNPDDFVSQIQKLFQKTKI